jgi:hypothetical protein
MPLRCIEEVAIERHIFLTSVFDCRWFFSRSSNVLPLSPLDRRLVKLRSHFGLGGDEKSLHLYRGIESLSFNSRQ